LATLKYFASPVYIISIFCLLLCSNTCSTKSRRQFIRFRVRLSGIQRNNHFRHRYCRTLCYPRHFILLRMGVQMEVVDGSCSHD